MLSIKKKDSTWLKGLADVLIRQVERNHGVVEAPILGSVSK